MKKLVLAVIVYAAVNAFGDGSSDPKKWGGDMRIRYESVDDSVLDVARALTTRGALNYQHSFDEGLRLFVELEGVVGQGNFNDGGQNGNMTHSTIADADSLELNRFYVAFSPSGDDWASTLKVGRFNGNHADVNVDRYLSNIGWRQNHRTYDGIDFDGTFGESRLRASVIVNVNRVLGEKNPNPVLANWEVRVVGLQFDRKLAKFVKSEAYTYHFVFDDVPRFSTETFGLKLHADVPLSKNVDAFYLLDLASQKGIAENPNQDDRYSYVAATLGLSLGSPIPIKLSVNSETFESNGEEAFITPLGAGHAFFGWADKFLYQPSIGINDIFLAGDVNFGGLNVKLRWHQLDSDFNSIDYGSEFDWAVSGKFGSANSWTVKGAHFKGNNDEENLPHLQQDTDKIYAWLSFGF